MTPRVPLTGPVLLLVLLAGGCLPPHGDPTPKDSADGPGTGDSASETAADTSDSGTSPVEVSTLQTDCRNQAEAGESYACEVWAVLPDGTTSTAVVEVEGAPSGMELVDGHLTWTPESGGAYTWSFVAGDRSVEWYASATEVFPLAATTAAADGSLALTATPTRSSLTDIRVSAPAGSLPGGSTVTLEEVVAPPYLRAVAPAFRLSATQPFAATIQVSYSPSLVADLGLMSAESLVLAQRGDGPWTPIDTGGAGLLAALSGAALASAWVCATSDACVAFVGAELSELLGAEQEAEFADDGYLDFQPGDRNCIFVHGIMADGTTWDPDADEAGAWGDDRCDHTARYQYPWGWSATGNGYLMTDVFRSLPAGSTYTLIVHSNGGLVSRSMLELADPGSQANLDALLTLATPHQGGVVDATIIRDLDWSKGAEALGLYGVRDLSVDTLADPDSFLNQLDPSPAYPVFCMAAIDPDEGDGDGVVTEASALAPCSSTRATFTMPDGGFDPITAHSWMHAAFHESGADVVADGWLGWDSPCTNLVDDDGDGWTDADDPDCGGGTAEAGTDPAWECNDGFDNDDDGYADAEDDDCTSAFDDEGIPAEVCASGIDEDLDGLVDCDDPDCDGASECEPCGDEFVDVLEDCDGANLDGEDCVSLGFGSGSLACTPECTFDTTTCSAGSPEVCGDGVDNDLDGLVDCADTDCALSCCGNGVVNTIEACDGAELGGLACTDLGFEWGTLACGATCALDTGACGSTESCEDGLDNDLDGASDCADTECTADAVCLLCGNGSLDPEEDCDGTDLGGSTCTSLGYDAGLLACDATCLFDTSACRSAEECGDGTDNDLDGDVDCSDSDCGASMDCVPVEFVLGSLGVQFEGPEIGTEAGNAVAGVGDVNADGFDDVLVGATNYNDGTDMIGAAFLVLGSASLSSTDLGSADARYEGAADEDYAGSAVAGAGDFNGDGFDDILVGASKNDDGGTDAGAAYLVLGSAAPAGLSLSGADAEFTGVNTDDGVGSAVSMAGDVDGDGFDDLIFGSMGNDDAGSGTGAALLVRGSATPTSASLSAADAILTGEYETSTGSSVAGVGDINGDGLADVLIGAYALGSYSEGGAYVVLGPIAGGSWSLSAADARLEGTSGMTGNSVSGAGDVNGDGLDDMLIGAYRNSDAASSAGATYLVIGSASPASGSLSSAQAEFTGEAASDYSGYSVSGAGDVDADGFADMLIGAYYNDDGGSVAGAAYLILGSSAPASLSLSAANAQFTGEAAYDIAGYAVAGAQDADGDGRDDLLIGAKHNGDGGYLSGAAYLIFGSAL